MLGTQGEVTNHAPRQRLKREPNRGRRVNQERLIEAPHDPAPFCAAKQKAKARALDSKAQPRAALQSYVRGQDSIEPRAPEAAKHKKSQVLGVRLNCK